VKNRNSVLLVGLFCAALALRPQIVGIGPLLPEIQRDLGLSHAVAGLLVAIPVLSMGAFALPAPLVRARLGSRLAMAVCLGGLAVFGTGRAAASNGVIVLVLTLPIGIGLGLAGALMPSAVKELFPNRPAFATGVCVTGLATGAAAAGAAAVPIADVAGGWRGSLATFSILTAGLLGAWLWTTRHVEFPHGEPARPKLPFRSSLAWLLAVVSTLNSGIFFGLIAWLPDIYVERGWSKETAGLLLGVLSASSIPTLLVVLWWADRLGSRRLYLTTSALVMLGALLGVLFLPGGAWLWAGLFGASNTLYFALNLTLPLDLTSRPDEVGAITALMLGVGYVLAGFAPFVLGATRDASGGFRAALWLLAAAAAALVLISLRLTDGRLRDYSKPARSTRGEPDVRAGRRKARAGQRDSPVAELGSRLP
jgi:MFS transporter, CP family, cyanate transporter